MGRISAIHHADPAVRHVTWSRLLSMGLHGLLGMGPLVGCAVGPEYVRPAPPVATGYTEAALPTATDASQAPSGGAQHFAPNADVPGAWWALFRSPALTRLVAEALRHNPTLTAQAEALRQAQETTLAQAGALLPSVAAQPNRTRQELSSAEGGAGTGPAFSQTFSVYDAQVNVSYTFDVWGQARRGIEADRARAEQQLFTLEGAANMLAANTVTAAITSASLAAQVDAEQALVAAESQLLQTVRSQFELGAVTGTDVATQESQLANTEALVVPLQVQYVQARDQLAAYLGRVPEDAALPRLSLAELTLPDTLPVSLPSSLVEQRPDIRAAAAQLHAATATHRRGGGQPPAAIRAERLCRHRTGKDRRHLHARQRYFGSAHPALAPVFQGGTLLHQQRAAVAAARGAAASYRASVVNAFQNVADVLTGPAGRCACAGGQRACRTRCIPQPGLGTPAVRRRRRVLPDGADCADAVSECRAGLIRAQAARYTDTAALFTALGGGWWNRHDVPPPPENLLRSLLP